MVSIKNSTDYSKRVPHIATKLGRFGWFRDIQSAILQFNHRVNNLPDTEIKSISQEPIINLFDTQINLEQCIAKVAKTAMYEGFYLNKKLTTEIFNFAVANECIEPNSFKHYHILDVDNNMTSDYIYRGLVTNACDCNAIKQILGDATLLAIATKFLGYTPSKITQHLTWSLPVPVEESEILKHYPASRWHYDVVGVNSLTVNFYLTDVMDEESGPHQYVANSHKNLPWQLLMKPNTMNESTVDKYFSQLPKKSIIGKAGYGFIENPLCIHRVKPPKHNPRLILQIRYS